MPKSTKAKVGNKAKGRRSAKSKVTGKYERQRQRTLANKLKNKAKAEQALQDKLAKYR